MNNSRKAFLLAVFALVPAVFPALAHHSFTAEFDFKKTITLQGTVVEFDFINPHGRIFLDVKNPDGTTTRWAVEVTNPNALARAGWRKTTLRPGDSCTVTGFLAKDGSHLVNGNKVTVPDGRILSAGSTAPTQDGGDATSK